MPTKSSYLCGEHFTDNDFSYSSVLPYSNCLRKKYLKKDAVPSVFKFPEHLIKIAAKERRPINRNAPAEKPLYSGAWSPKQPKLCDHTYASKVSAKNVKAQYQQILKRKIG